MREKDVLAETGALDGARHREHLPQRRARPGGLRRADDDDVVGPERAVLDGVHGGAFTVEDTRRALEDRLTEAGRLHHGTLGRKGALEDRQATRPVDRLGQGADDLAVDVRRVDVGEVLGEGPAGDREAVTVEQTGVEQGPHDDRDSADAVDVGRDELAEGLDVQRCGTLAPMRAKSSIDSSTSAS